MNQRKTLDQLTSDELDHLYDQLAAEEADNEQLRRWLLRCSHREAIDRVRALADQWENALTPDRTYARALRAALEAPAPAPAATQAGDGWEQQNDGTWTLPFGDGYVNVPAYFTAEERARFAAALTQRQEPAPDELTAEEARALADELGTDLYRAQDALEFVAECCDIADREQRPITTATVREWLKGAQCGRQIAADNPGLYDRIAAMFSGPLPPPGDVPPPVALPCSHAHLRQPHDPHRWQPQPGMRPVQCPGWEHVPAAPDTVTDPAHLRDLYAAALYEHSNPGHRWPDAHPHDVTVYGADADAVLRVRDRHLEQLRGRLALADAELQQWANAESADAAAGSYAGRAEEAEQQRDQYAGVLRDILSEFTVIRDLRDGQRIAYRGPTIVPADYDRWNTALDPQEQP